MAGFALSAAQPRSKSGTASVSSRTQGAREEKSHAGGDDSIDERIHGAEAYGNNVLFVAETWHWSYMNQNAGFRAGASTNYHAGVLSYRFVEDDRSWTELREKANASSEVEAAGTARTDGSRQTFPSHAQDGAMPSLHVAMQVWARIRMKAGRL